MGQIVVDGLSDSAIATLKSRASRHARTVEAEALAILEEAAHQANGSGAANGPETNGHRPREAGSVSPEIAAARKAGYWSGPDLDAMSDQERADYFAVLRARAEENRRATQGRVHSDSADILREERNKIRWEHES